MKKSSFFLLLLALCYSSYARAQQYGWTSISGNLPKFHNDTVIINGGADTLIANISGISFIDDNHGWICTYHPFDGEPSAVLETVDGGQTWTEHSAPFAGQDIYMIDEENGYFGASNGMIFRTTDGGETWTFHGHLTVALYDLEFPPRPAQIGYAGGKDGHLSQITSEGVFPFSLGLNGSVYCMSFPAEEHGWALLDYQLIIRYIDGEWISDSSHPFSSKSWLYFLDNQRGWCVGEMFLKTTVGIDWTMLEHNLTDAYLTGVLFTSATNGFIIGGSKALLKYTINSGAEEQGDREEECLELYPNPTSGKFKVQSAKSKVAVGVQRVEVVDITGKLLEKLNTEPGTWNMEYDITGCPSGVYFIKIMVDDRLIVKKIIKA